MDKTSIPSTRVFHRGLFDECDLLEKILVLITGTFVAMLFNGVLESIYSTNPLMSGSAWHVS